MIPLSEQEVDKKTFALFNLAFRSLFLGGTLFVVLAILFWISFQQGLINWKSLYPPVWWHAHELLFGFGAAIIVGFLLTAVQTWTGVKTVTGKPLIFLFCLWCITRLLFFFAASREIQILLAVLDCSFLLISAAFLAKPIYKIKQRRNAFFPILLLVFACLNAINHYAIINAHEKLSTNSLHATIFLITLIISIMGGRVIPFFTANASSYERKENISLIELISIASVILLLLSSLIGLKQLQGTLLGSLCAIACVSHSLRLFRWGGQFTLRTPLLWSLHLSYAFIPLGFALMSLWSFKVISDFSAALHCFTVGSMMGMILAMISRVSLGHTGRMLQPPALMPYAFLCIALAAITRTLGVILFPEYYFQLVMFSGMLCVVAFLCFLIFYTPFLIKSRVDGKPG